MARKIVQVSSQYTDKQGNKKWRNATVGCAFVYDNGDVSIALDPGISVHGGEGIKISLRDPFPEDQKQQQQRPAAKPQQSDDQIPF